VGAGGFASLNLDWFGKGDSLGGQSISYTNELLFLYQKVTFKLGDSNFFLGPQYRLLATDASFAGDDAEAIAAGVPTGDLQSQTAGLGAVLAYDSLDQPFSPTRGVRAEVSYSQQAEGFGGDFEYGRLNLFGITYVPLGEKFVLGLRVDGGLITGGADDAPFYDLPGLMTRGIPRGRFVDNAALLAEAELRYDVSTRWSLIGFGSVGRVADDFGDIWSADTHTAVGTGFRYLIARQYGLRVGLDVGYSDEDDWTVYVTIGTGWVRP
jgi:outer membrane protein assembly factor BamA